MVNFPVIAITGASTAQFGRLAAFKAGWKQMPAWKKWVTGIAILAAGIGIVAAILAATVFTGGTAATVIGVIAVGCGIAAGAAGAIANGHTFIQAIKARRYGLACFAALGCIASLLGGLTSIFSAASVISTAVQTGLGLGAAGGTVTASMGATISQCTASTDKLLEDSNIDSPLLEEEGPYVSYQESMSRIVQSQPSSEAIVIRVKDRDEHMNPKELRAHLQSLRREAADKPASLSSVSPT